jgi:hypothetical protein
MYESARKLAINQAKIGDLLEKIKILEENGCQNPNIIIRRRGQAEKRELESQLREFEGLNLAPERILDRGVDPVDCCSEPDGKDPLDQSRGTKRMRSSDEVKAGFCGKPNCQQEQVLSARKNALQEAKEARKRAEAKGMTCAYRFDLENASEEHSCQECFCTEVWQGKGNTGQPDNNFKYLVHDVLTRLRQSNFTRNPRWNPNNVTYDSGDAFTPPQSPNTPDPTYDQPIRCITTDCLAN